MNKQRIVKTKRKNRIKKALTKLPEQIGLCRFIEFRNIEHPKVNGHFTNHAIFTNLQGLQIEHKFLYIQNGKIIKIMINKRNAKILKTFDGIPEWADPLLIEQYETFNKS